MTDVKIGSEYSRKRGSGAPRIRIIGTRNRNWIAEPTEFAAPFEISANRLRIEYGTNGERAPEIDENEAWQQLPRNWLDKAINAARERERDQQSVVLAPEAKLAAEAAAEAAEAE